MPARARQPREGHTPPQAPGPANSDRRSPRALLSGRLYDDGPAAPSHRDALVVRVLCPNLSDHRRRVPLGPPLEALVEAP